MDINGLLLVQISSGISVDAWQDPLRTRNEVLDCDDDSAAIVVVQELPHGR